MSQDVFSYQKPANSNGQVASSDFAVIQIGDSQTKAALVQSFNANYGQQIEEVLQVGDSQVYWVPGRPRGDISIASLVGTDGFFRGWLAPCGLITKAAVSLDGDGGSKCKFEGSGSLTFSGAIVESLGVSMDSGRQVVTQNARIRVASMSAS